MFLGVALLCATTFVYAQKIAIKTNVLADITTTINLAAEFGLQKKYTVDLNMNYNPWNFKDNKKIKHILVQPELRYWFCERFSGHFIGIHAHGGSFNIGGITMPLGIGKGLKLKDYRYEGNFYGGGISYGYQWVLSDHWNLEGNIGAGYARVKYDKYKCKNCGRLVEKGRNYNYWGVTKAAISLTYLF